MGVWNSAKHVCLLIQLRVWHRLRRNISPVVKMSTLTILSILATSKHYDLHLVCMVFWKKRFICGFYRVFLILIIVFVYFESQLMITNSPLENGMLSWLRNFFVNILCRQKIITACLLISDVNLFVLSLYMCTM